MKARRSALFKMTLTLTPPIRFFLSQGVTVESVLKQPEQLPKEEALYIWFVEVKKKQQLQKKLYQKKLETRYANGSKK